MWSGFSLLTSAEGITAHHQCFSVELISPVASGGYLVSIIYSLLTNSHLLILVSKVVRRFDDAKVPHISHKFLYSYVGM